MSPASSLAMRFRSLALVAAFVAAPLLVSMATSPGEKKASPINTALEAAFPKAEIQRITCTLDEDARKRVGKLASQKAYPRKTPFAYVAKVDGKVVGTAFFDSHPVRTKRETLMVIVEPDGSLRGIEIIAFQEPPEYIAQDSFYASLQGRHQGRELQLGRGLDGTTGATLTCEAVAKASRRVLGLHAVLGKKVGRDVPEAKDAQKARRSK